MKRKFGNLKIVPSNVGCSFLIMQNESLYQGNAVRNFEILIQKITLKQEDQTWIQKKFSLNKKPDHMKKRNAADF